MQKSQAIDAELFEKWVTNNEKSQKLYELIGTGAMDGYITHDNFWAIYQKLYTKYPKFISKPIVFGKTYKGVPMKNFKVGMNINDQKRNKRHEVLFTALHHSREPTSLSMLTAVFLSTVQMLQSGNIKAKRLFKNIDIQFIPVVNVDGFNEINKNYFKNKDPWAKARLRRKNLNVTNCANPFDAGVDINRNYPYKWGFNNQGSCTDPCRDDYRGPSPASEPETKSMMNFIKTNPFIKSAINFHSYGDLWIFPNNWDPDANNKIFKKQQPTMYNSYMDFMKSCPHQKLSEFGNAQGVIKYQANGEASDWMLNEHQIMAFSPEIGNDNKAASDHFYLTKANIP